MGFLRTITLYNDGWHQNEIRDNPEAFVKELTEAMNRTDEHHAPDRLSSYLKVQTSRHADDHTVFVHRGNTVVDISHRSFEELPVDIQLTFLKTAQAIITHAKKNVMARKKGGK